MDLISLAKSVLNSDIINVIAKTNDISSNQAQDATTSTLQLLLSGLTKNVATKQGANELDQALSEDHDGSILDNVSQVLSGTLSSKTIEGTKILSHVLKGKTDIAADVISQKSGIDKETALNLLIKLAPIALGILGKMKKDTGSDADGVRKILTSTTAQEKSTGNTFMNIATQLLDKDNDGSIIDDVIDIASGFFSKK